MEAYAGGRQKTHQDNFDDLDLEGPARSDNGKELNDDDNFRHRLVTPGVQQKKSPGIKINLHSNNKKAAEQLKQIPIAQVPLPGTLPFRGSFVPIGGNNTNVPVPPKVPGPPANLINEAEELKLRNEKKKDTAIEKTKLQQELQKLLTVEIFHGEGPGRYMYRGVLFKKANPNSKHMYICHVCKIQVLDNDIINHSNGKKHAANMEGVKIIDYKKEQEENRKEYANRKKLVEQEFKPAAVEPGQPAPPGFEDTVRIVPLCQSMLDAFGDAPLIGLEYLVELLAAEDENCHVVCFLCDRRGESLMQNVRQNIISHMIGTTHRMTYLKRHFPRAHEALMKIQNDKVLKTELSRHVRSVVGSIEKAYGRLNPVLVDGNTFRNRCNEYRERVEKASHFSEAPGKTFEECIIVSKKANSPESSQYSPSRRGRSPERRIRSRSPNPRIFGRSPDRRRSPFHKKGSTVKSWRNQSQSPEAGSSRVSTHRPRHDEPVKRPVRDNTPTLDEESSPEVIGVHRGTKNQGKMPLSDVLRDTTPVSNSDSPLSLSPPPNRSPRRRRTSFTRHVDLFGREVERRREFKPSRSPESRRSPDSRHGHRGRRVSRSPKRRRKSISCSPISSKSGSRSPRAMSRTSDSSSRPLNIREKLDRFKRESEEIERDIKKKSRYYHTQPEKHPAYNGEWKVFWNRKQMEVKETGRDPAKYDYTPEWKVFWNERVEELYIHEYQERKRELKRKYNLTDEEPKKLSKASRGQSSRDENASKVGSMSDIKDTWKALTGNDIKEEPKTPEKPEYHTVLGILRQLSVLEPQLGSLGVTINKLLGKAISMEKVKKGSSEDLLLNIENTVLLETIKEKFRGQLMAGIVERFNVYATRNAITNLTIILEDAPPPVMKDDIEKAEEAPKPVIITARPKPAEPKVVVSTAAAASQKSGEAVAVPGVGNIDRAAIAMQIANALLAQGKTDVSNEELAQLVEAVVGMAQKQNAEASELEKKVEEEKIAKMEELVASPKEVKPTDMNEDDLISCLKIFEFLPEHEKHSIIMQLQRLEETNPEKVKELRKYVNASTEIDKESPKTFDKLDSDDDDYLDSDVMKAVTKNVEQQTKPKAADSKTVAEATASMMANLKDKMPARKMEPISTELPLPKIGSMSAAQPLSLPPVDPMALPTTSQVPMYPMDPSLQFDPYAQQPQYQYQQYGNPAYNSYYRSQNNWHTNHVRPGSEFNLVSLPMPFASVKPKEKKAVSKRTTHSSALIQLVGKKE